MVARVVANVMSFGAVIAACTAACLNAQTISPSDYPTRQITFVVPYAPGGGTDTVTRIIAPKLSDSWKQTIVIENRAGAGGIVGNNLVARASPDGYTVLIGITQLVQAPALHMRLPYDVFKDFAPVSQLTVQPNFFLVPSAAGITSLEQFVARAKANAGKHSFGSYGAGTTSHLYVELLKKLAGIELVHVPYKGAAPLLSDVLASHVNCGLIDPLTAGAQIRAGAVKPLAVTGPARSKLFPDVPTFAELGYSGFESLGWTAAFVPAGTPKTVIAKISEDMGRVIRLPDITARIYGLGSEPVGNTSEEFAVILKADYDRWAKIASDANIRLD